MRNDQCAERRDRQHEPVNALGRDAEDWAEDGCQGAGDWLGRSLANTAGNDIDQRQSGRHDAEPEAAGLGDKHRGDGFDGVHEVYPLNWPPF